MTHTDTGIDWLACELIEQIPGKVSGRPIVRGTRILPDAIVDSYDLGETIEELREGFPSLSVLDENLALTWVGLRSRMASCYGQRRKAAWRCSSPVMEHSATSRI